MKPDYKNWVPKGMIYGLLAGTIILAIGSVLSFVAFKNVSTPVRICIGTLLALGTLACGKSAEWSIVAYRKFSYNGNRQLSKQIIE